jgi:hypothetical protein
MHVGEFHSFILLSFNQVASDVLTSDVREFMDEYQGGVCQQRFAYLSYVASPYTWQKSLEL